MSLPRLRAAGVAALVMLSACGGGPDAAALGEFVDVDYVDPETNAATTLSMTIQRVRPGTVAELEEAGLEFDPEERSLVPYYVDAHFTNVGDNSVERGMRPSIEDQDGNLINPTVIFDFSGDEGEPSGPCPDTNEGELAPSEAFEDCTLFLVPAGVTVDRVSFLSQPAEGEPEFVYWAAE